MDKVVKNTDINDYDYFLPEDRIAQYPVEERDKSKLLIYRKGIISEDIFRNISEYLRPDTLLVFNNTRVISARLLFRKETGSKIEVLLLEPLNPPDYGRVFSSKVTVQWKCMIGNLKKWKKGTLSLGFSLNNRSYRLMAEKTEPAGKDWGVRFSWEPADICFAEVISSAGHIPLPPYVNREDEEIDKVRYQTVYGRVNGSVASPTAGLHFTENVINEILYKGIKRDEITLHVGAGTFQPVKSDNIENHVMHCEHFSVSGATIENLLSFEDRIIAVGTTSVRTLESLYWLGIKTLKKKFEVSEDFYLKQWEPYQCSDEIPVKDSLSALLNTIEKKGTGILNASTELMIIPGYKFRLVKGMITNFHQPRSTLLLLVSAFIGEDWKQVYDFAAEHRFRFLSYGDSSLLIK